MYIKSFQLSDEEAINKFVDSVELVETGAVQVTGENTVCVFYMGYKKDYQTRFLTRLIEGLNNNLFNENIRLESAIIEFQEAEEQQGELSNKSPEGKVTKEKNKEVAVSHENIRVINKKLSLYIKWLKKLEDN